MNTNLFNVGRYTLESNFGTFPNQLINYLPQLSPAELKIVLFFQCAPPATKFNITSIAKKIGVKTETTNTAIKSLIAKEIINIKTMDNGITRYCINFKPIFEFSASTASTIEFTEPTITDNITANSQEVKKEVVPVPSPQIEAVKPTNTVQESNIKSKYYDDGVTHVTPAPVTPAPAPIKDIETVEQLIQPEQIKLIDSGIKDYESKYIGSEYNRQHIIDSYNFFISLNPELNQKMKINQFEIILLGSWVKYDKTYVRNFDKTMLNKELNIKFFYDKVQYGLIKSINNQLQPLVNIYKELKEILVPYQLAV